MDFLFNILKFEKAIHSNDGYVKYMLYSRLPIIVLDKHTSVNLVKAFCH